MQTAEVTGVGHDAKSPNSLIIGAQKCGTTALYDMTLKIAVCVRSIHVGGSSRVAVHLSQRLAEAGHTVTLMVEQSPSSPLAGAVQGCDVAVLSQRPCESGAGVIRRTVAFFHRQQFDIVFLITGQPFASVQRSLGMLPDTTALVPVACGDTESVYARVVSTAAWWQVAATVSPRILQTLTSLLPHKPIQLLAAGIPLPTADELAVRAGWSLPLRLFYVGRLEESKGVQLLPAILGACLSRDLPVTLTVIGDGEERALLEQACRDANVAHLVTFAGYQPDAVVYQAMRSHHVLLFPSTRREGLGLVLLEAQANGCVPVTSHFPGATDYAIAADETGLLAAVGAPDAFAAQIAALTVAERWQRYSRAGIERTHRLFSFAEMGRQYGELVSDIDRGVYPLPTPRSQTADRLPHLSRRDRLPRALLPLAVRLRHVLRSRPTTGLVRHDRS